MATPGGGPRWISEPGCSGAAGETLLAQILALPGVVAEPGDLAFSPDEDWPIFERVLALNGAKVLHR